MIEWIKARNKYLKINNNYNIEILAVKNYSENLLTLNTKPGVALKDGTPTFPIQNIWLNKNRGKYISI